MACLSDAATAQEDAFFAALAATRSWRLEGETLTLLDSGNGALVVLGSRRSELSAGAGLLASAGAAPAESTGRIRADASFPACSM